MRTVGFALIAVLAASSAQAQAPKGDEGKTFYALGASIGQSLAVFSLSPAELEQVRKGMVDAVTGKPLAADPMQYREQIGKLAKERAESKGKEYADKAAKEKGAVKTESGLVYKELKAGSGPSPQATDTVKVHYRGTLINGNEFDSSYKRGKPAEFPLSGVVACWTEGVQKMKVGGKAKLVCPPSIAYGDRGQPPTIPGGATLVFEVELIEIKK